jgi:probable F420-dependent oxidoreductase
MCGVSAGARRFRFGLVYTGLTDGGGWRDFARRVEGSGFSTLLVADHYLNPMACGPLIMAAAAATTTLRVGSYVYNNDFRNPALLAKEAATIDVLSDGRLELGIGAGWMKPEYVAAGVLFDPPATRAARFEEAVGIVRRLLAGDVVQHRGTFYRVRDLPGWPQPVQREVPLLIGGGGPRMIRFAARTADIVGLVPRSLPDGGLDPAGFPAAATDEKIGWLRDAAGDRDPERSALVFGLGDSLDEAVKQLEIDPAAADGSPHLLAGGDMQMADSLREARERWGLSYFVFFERDMDKALSIVATLTAT